MNRIALRLLRWWVRLYTSGLPARERTERRSEIESNHYEHTHDAEGRHSRATGWQLLSRVVRGVPSDLIWRLSKPGVERRVGRGGEAIALVAHRIYIGVAAAGVALVLTIGLILSVVLLDGPSAVSLGKMAEPRYAHSATLLGDGRVIVTGGRARAETWPALSIGNLSSVEMYDAFAGLWSPVRDMREPQSGHSTTFLDDGRVLVAGGLKNNNAAGFDDRYGLGVHAAAEIYDPSTDTWSPAGSMKIPVVQPLAVRLGDGRVLFAGGWSTPQNGSGVANVFHPSSNTWTLARSMKEARAEHAGLLLSDGTVLVVGGVGSESALRATTRSSAERYDPATDTWTSTYMAEARTHATATLLLDGRVLVEGGRENSRRLSSAEIYDPSTGTWAPAGSMNQIRSGHAAVLLADDRVLVTGGRDDELSLSSAEIFDPNTGTWSTTGSMGKRRTAHVAVRLRDGRVLAIGGWDRDVSDREAHASSEVYDPITGTWARY